MPHSVLEFLARMAFGVCLGGNALEKTFLEAGLQG